MIHGFCEDRLVRICFHLFTIDSIVMFQRQKAKKESRVLPIKSQHEGRAQPVIIGDSEVHWFFFYISHPEACSQVLGQFIIMKLVAVATVLFIAAVLAADEKKEEERPKTYRRLIPADVLRDFPGMCFASTRCATIEPNKSWDLSPFCGRSTCVPAEDNSGRLFELVEDCGPLPKSNPKCKLSEKTVKTASFPDCCPVFECEEGAKLEYPEIPTVPPPTEAEESEKATPTPKP